MIGYIYQLHSGYTDDGVYVGSTTNFDKRKNYHKSNCYNENCKEYNYKVYKYIRDYGGWRNWLMLIVEEFEYNDKAELLEREQYWIKELKANLNSQDAVRDKDYYKNYREENKEKLEKYDKKYREENKDYYKKYREENKEFKRNYNKKYYEENREKISENNKQKFDCECGGKYIKINKLRHINTKKHQAYLQQRPGASS